MIDIELLRKDPVGIARALARRGEPAGAVERAAQLDAAHRRIIVEADELRAQRNASSKAIGALLRDGKTVEAETHRAEVRRLGERLAALEAKEREAEGQVRALLLTLPNVPTADTPDGLDASGNVVVRQEGTPQEAPFPLKPHWELAEHLGITDMDRGAKLSGARFYVLGEAGARLQRALTSWMLDMHRTRHGYHEVGLPYLVRSEALVGSGNLPKFADNLYHDAEEDLWLIPTAEVPLTNLHRNEILDLAALPLKYIAQTPCFRREKTAAGRDVRGIKRVHQFEKVEMYQFVAPERSEAALAEIVEHASEVSRGLGIPFRVLQLCTGDLGFPSAKSFDIEMWAPGSQEWLEVSSCSNCTDFQARRANIRFRRERGSRTEFVHTLNGSGLALPRVLIAVLETYQEPDGSVRVPGVLAPYLGGARVLEPVKR